MNALLLHLLILCVSVISSPVDYPIKVDLPVYDEPDTPHQSKEIHLAEPVHTENHPRDDSLNRNTISSKSKLEAFTGLVNSKSESIGKLGYFALPSYEVESAVMETEGFGSKKLSIKENIQHAAAGFLQPKPIVDTIKEEEKYGNNGDKFYKVGKAVVGGAEGISNFVNAIIAIPGSLISSITRSATAKLNNIGGKLVGL
ncbi:uncharacterized protein LOC126979091 [Leptidea sinapis]|uniref:Uncharacterized protein n=1 Tax=Leptidea sinapis TaxID=189913 RepID=A0A5E4PMF6_9NEOP|nr:uncharacterized protein LOC126979091 [Leptidea sinapis]VVC86254.1 unnamed protein product [Leptidea sinapis]